MMKTLYYVLITLLLITIRNRIYSQTSPTGGIVINTQNSNYIECDQKNSNIPCVKKGEYVVKFLQSISPNEKISIRKRYKVASFKTCPCGDSYIEYWKVFNTRSIRVLDSVSNLPDDKEEKDVLVDGSFISEHQFYYGKGLIDSNNSVKLTKKMFEERMLFPQNRLTTNIAIIDTGLDFGHFKNPILYDSSKKSCVKGSSGWNFVNDTPDVRDDNGHGTIVTEIITSNLKRWYPVYNYSKTRKIKKINYSILPVKAFDKEGKGNYFDLVCAMNYIKQFKDIHIINASFGYKRIVRANILEGLIKELRNEVLIIASAGNNGDNIDKRGNEYFPAGYKSANIITVGGFRPIKLTGRGRFLLMHSKSNFGITSVDIAAPFSYKLDENISLKKQEGTSFSTAYITAKAIEILSKKTNRSKKKMRRYNRIFKQPYFHNDPNELKLQILITAKSSSNLKRFILGGRYFD